MAYFLQEQLCIRARSVCVLSLVASLTEESLELLVSKLGKQRKSLKILLMMIGSEVYIPNPSLWCANDVY